MHDTPFDHTPQHDTQIIRVDEVRTQARVGVSEAERARPQPLTVSVTLTLTGPPDYEARDTLDATIDYDAVIGFVRDGLGRTPPARLIETLADRIAAHCLALSPKVRTATVTIVKPAVLGALGRVSVTLTRHAHTALAAVEPLRRAEAGG
jgi:dihydroneopterin aldolase